MHEDDPSCRVDAQRRRLLRAAAGAAVLATLPATAARPARTPFRIDVHGHAIPDFYRQAVQASGTPTARSLPDWSPQAAVRFMDDYGIQAQLLSISEPGVDFLPTSAERIAMARRLNDYMAQLAWSGDADVAGRFGAAAVLPLGNADDPQEMRAAADEAERALLQLKLDGIGLLSSVDGVYPGDPRFDPLLRRLDALGATVFVHPVTPKAYPESKVPTFVYEFPFDTTRAVCSLLYHGAFGRFPRIRWVLAHAGGAIPFLAYRVSMPTVYPLVAQNLGIEQLADTNFRLRQLYYDTALSQAPSAMKSVRELTSVSHILFGSDWPFAGPEYVLPGDPAPQLAQSFDDAELQQVQRDNALRLLPRLAARLPT